MLVPKLIDISLPIKFISAHQDSSFAVDIEGGLSYWGWNGDDIQWKPKKINVENVVKTIYWGGLIVLKESGKLFEYSFDENKIIRKIIVDLKVEDIFENLCETEECVYRREEFYLKKTNFINFYDYYSSNYNKFYKTIDVKSEDIDGQQVKYMHLK